MLSRFTLVFAGFTCLLLCLSSCSPDHSAKSDESAFRDLASSIKDRYCPDRRVAVFDVYWEKRGETVILEGEVDNPAAKQELVFAFESRYPGRIVDSVVVLPDSRIGDRKFGIVAVSVGNVRARPGNSEELTTQLTMGMVVKILKQQFGYYYVQSPDRYLGWLDYAVLRIASQREVDEWTTTSKVITVSLYGTIRESPSPHAPPVSDVVAACLLKQVGHSGKWTSVELPDGRRGFIETTAVQDYKTWKQSRRLNGENIVKTAKSLLGIPYLWGGTSTKAMDCSGFTKNVFWLNGLELSRDANQQATMGDPVATSDDLRFLRKGDLLFFGQKRGDVRPERITHVGIYLDKHLFIHCSGRVQYGSFDPESPYYDERRVRQFVRVRRVIPESGVPELAHAQ